MRGRPSRPAEPWWRRWYVVAAVLWIVRSLTLDHGLLVGRPVWAGWFDQSRYLASALALAHGNLTPGAHWYPLGYPLLAAPFAWPMPGDPFVLLDLILFLVTGWAFRRVAARLGIAPWPATWCFLATTLVDTKIAGTWTHPWTSTLSAALIWLLIDRTIAVCSEEKGRGRRPLAGAGALIGALPLVRPVDGLLSLTCLVIVFVALIRGRRSLIPRLLSLIVGGAVPAIVYALLHLAIYGPHPTAYMTASAKTGFVPGDIGWKAYVLLVDPEPWFPGGQSILQRLPWIVPGVAGLLARAAVGNARDRWVIAFLFLMVVPVSAIMLTYADLQPPGLWFFGNVHYFKWTLPAFGAGIVLWWRLLAGRKGRLALAVAMLVVVLPLAIRITPVPVAEAVPARMLLFRGDTPRDWSKAYFAPAVVTDRSGTMHNVNDFHQIPDTTGERAIAISRLFAADPRRSDPGDPAAPAGQAPYARFGERVTFLGLR